MASCVHCGGQLHGRQKKYCSAPCNKLGSRELWLKKVYNITLEDYDAILAFQDGRCGVCRRPKKPDETFHVDHEHGGHVRGLCCSYCNTRLIGRLKRHDLAQNLADYLRDPPATKALGRTVVAPGRPKKKRQPRKRAR